MKKLLVLVFSALFLLSVTACSSGDNTENEETNQDNQTVENEDTDSNAEEPAEDESDNATNDANDEQTNEENTADTEETSDVPSEIADFEETDQLATTIDDLGSLKPEIETDNPNKRIILFADDSNQKKFKSIFIKEKQRLKIIELDKEGEPLFNDTI